MWWRPWGELGRRQDTIEFTYKDLQDASAILQVRSRIQVTQLTQGAHGRPKRQHWEGFLIACSYIPLRSPWDWFPCHGRLFVWSNFLVETPSASANIFRRNSQVQGDFVHFVLSWSILAILSHLSWDGNYTRRHRERLRATQLFIHISVCWGDDKLQGISQPRDCVTVVSEVAWRLEGWTVTLCLPKLRCPTSK